MGKISNYLFNIAAFLLKHKQKRPALLKLKTLKKKMWKSTN